MKTIINKEEFIELVETYEELICFVHSTWSGTSVMSLKKFNELATNRPELNLVIIVNDGADSFIYQWLKDQEETFEINNTNLKKRPHSWIHGNGEVFGVNKGNFIWYEHSLRQQSLADLDKKGYWKNNNAGITQPTSNAGDTKAFANSRSLREHFFRFANVQKAVSFVKTIFGRRVP